MVVNLRLKTYVFLVLIVLFSSSGNIFLSEGMKQIGAVRVRSAMPLKDLRTRVDDLMAKTLKSFPPASKSN